VKCEFSRVDDNFDQLDYEAHLTTPIRKYMDTKNNLSEKKLVERLVTPEHLSPAFVAACDCSIDKELLEQELEYLWDDSDSAGKSYEIYLGKISRNPIVKSKITGKYFALPWSVIIKLALAKGIDK
jgi:hypothetical protein